jgi:hypothetical protein
MTVPFALFRPVTLADFDPIDTNGDGVKDFTREAWRIDGGPLAVGTSTTTLLSVLNKRVTTLRVFVVSGQAPDTLADMDGNGVVDIRDAEIANLPLLSRETVVRLQTYNQDVAAGYAVLFDFFGDGLTPPPAPAGSGGIKDVPR